MVLTGKLNVLDYIERKIMRENNEDSKYNIASTLKPAKGPR